MIQAYDCRLNKECNKMKILFFILFVLSLVANAYDGKMDPGVSSQMPKELEGVGIDQKLGAQLDLSLKFKNENNQDVTLGSFYSEHKPVIISLVYFSCPGLCNFHLNGLTEALKQVDWSPKDKFEILAVDDGSKDSTWQILQKFKNNNQIKIFKKENGGKYTALNYGIDNCTTEMIGCLDADSFVDSNALLYIIPHFKNKNVAAVTPSLKIQNPDSILGLVQNAEYSMGIFTRKVLGFLDAQYVTPGPFW
jgi:cellulose synthase/poly-beta-1,6-N-acetylglucosamine synthase-like glycosyltransferase